MSRIITAPMAIAIIRQLNEDHIQDLYALYQTAWWTKDRTVKDIRKMLAHSDIVVGLCDDRSDRLIGFARVLTDFVYKARLDDIILAESIQGLGLGRYLMDTVINLPELRAVQHIDLQCLPEMVPFYAQWGFAPDLQGVITLRRHHT
ncbi:MAG: GNAT family N-acetyltransferase [Cyanobacteria bacterium]|nr:GNAT family N-acetyltransferase [Cyanobacteriota bacterium]MDA0867523.1 GNAT family N-acetyltransferase [Cyanobacteriota bacterium]